MTGNNLSAQSIATGSLAQKGNSLSALKVTQRKNKGSWIVDSGASDHMTGDITLFKDFYPCQENLTVRIADGSLSKVTGLGSVMISEELVLEFVLLVPKLDCNLLSISKLTEERKCVAKFTVQNCVFQELSSGKTIGSEEMCSGLYILQIPPSRQPLKIAMGKRSFFVFRSSKNKDVMLWHYHLGHPNFVFLKKYFRIYSIKILSLSSVKYVK